MPTDKIKNELSPSELANIEAANKNKSDINKVKRYAFYGGGIATLGYSAYKIPKLPDHINYESLKIVGVIVGGFLIGAKLGNFKILTDYQPTPTEKVFRYIGGGVTIGGIFYFLSRGLVGTNIKTSIKVASVLALSTIAFFEYQENKLKKEAEARRIGR